jgi:hypothetical protein
MIDIILEDNTNYSYQDQQKVFITNIIKIKNQYSMDGISLEEMIISPAFWNFIVDNTMFQKIMGGITIPEDIENNIPVGYMMSMQVFVNFTLDRDKIILSPSLKNRRDEKIDNILNNTDKVTMVEIKIKSSNLY